MINNSQTETGCQFFVCFWREMAIITNNQMNGSSIKMDETLRRHFIRQMVIFTVMCLEYLKVNVDIKIMRSIEIIHWMWQYYLKSVNNGMCLSANRQKLLENAAEIGSIVIHTHEQWVSNSWSSLTSHHYCGAEIHSISPFFVKIKAI